MFLDPLMKCFNVFVMLSNLPTKEAAQSDFQIHFLSLFPRCKSYYAGLEAHFDQNCFFSRIYEIKLSYFTAVLKPVERMVMVMHACTECTCLSRGY